MENKIVVVRGGGDLATGVIQKLHRAGFRVLVLEVSQPRFVRSEVCLGQAVYDGVFQVEDIIGKKISSLDQAYETWDQGKIPILVDPQATCLKEIKPFGLVDAIIAKKNLGTRRDMAPATVALGPGFLAGKDVDIVIETNRGHNLGRSIFKGPVAANTGLPGDIRGFNRERVLRAPQAGRVEALVKIGDIVEKDQIVAKVGNQEVRSEIKGLVRGMVHPGLIMKAGEKIGDIDPRIDTEYKTISDKARNIAGGVLEALLILKN